VLGKSVNRGTAHFLIWVLKSGGECHFSVVHFDTMQHDAVLCKGTAVPVQTMKALDSGEWYTSRTGHLAFGESTPDTH
jgi:hypothetical protein